MRTAGYTFPRFPLLKQLPWLKEVSCWSAPTTAQRADSRDAFLLGGDGLISARLGIRDRVSTLERTLAPHLSSYNFGENANFFLEVVRPSRDFYPPIIFAPTAQHIWRVRDSAIILTAERDPTFELVTVSAVHPDLHVILRYASLKNLTTKSIADIGISFEAQPDIPFAIAGYRSRLRADGPSHILETLDELKTVIVGAYPRNTQDHERYRYLMRGLPGGTVRGVEDLFLHTDHLAPKASLEAIHYLAPALHESEEAARENGQRCEAAIAERGIAALFAETFAWWRATAASDTRFETSDIRFTELIHNNLLLTKTVERATAGYVVIDDYSGSWLRDHNGPHRLLLSHGKHEDVRRSMDRYYGLDLTQQALLSVYPSDFEPVEPLPREPDWANVEHFIPGDVPNFRAMWYWWYFEHTGDLEYVRERFDYITGAFLRQRLDARGYLADYCFDETYGIGPVGPMRKGRSCDNSFIALRAAQVLTTFAELLTDRRLTMLRDYRDNISAAIDKTFWLEHKGYYAMRITPDGKRDETPLSVGLLRPLWSGAMKGDDLRAIRSTLYTYEHLYHKNGFLRLIPTHDQTVTMAIGYLLTALKKIGHPGRDRVLNDVLKWADASGTFGEYLDETPKGPRQCFEHMAHRSRMWESGLNTQAVLDALIGFSPEAYFDRATLSPWIPKGWKSLSAARLRVGETYFSLLSERGTTRIRHTLNGLSGREIRVSVELTSKTKTRIMHNKRQVEVAWAKDHFGNYTTSITLPVRAGERQIIEL